MRIIIIDCDAQRRPIFAARAKLYAGGADVIACSSCSEQEVGPTDLVFCHVGDRQHKHESGALGGHLTKFAKYGGCFVAGFTGGTISSDFLKRMPAESRSFVVNRGASAGMLTSSFGDAVDRVVRAWVSKEGRPGPTDIAIAWIGFDPLLEAKLEVLSALLEDIRRVDDNIDAGEVPRSRIASLEVPLKLLSRDYPGILDIDQATAASVQARHDAILALRAVLFDEA